MGIHFGILESCAMCVGQLIDELWLYAVAVHVHRANEPQNNSLPFPFSQAITNFCPDKLHLELRNDPTYNVHVYTLI